MQAKTNSQTGFGFEVSSLLKLIFSALIIYVPVLTGGWLAKQLYAGNSWTGIIGVALCGLGIGFAIWARNMLGRNWSGKVMIQKEHSLIKEGPYGLVRHPQYTGLLLALAGTALVLGQIFGFIWVLFLVAGIIAKSKHEEKILANEFPNEYPSYKKSVNMIIPFGMFVIAPAVLFLYGIAHFVDGLDGSYGPGFAWTIGHLMFLFGLVTFGAIIVELHRRVLTVSNKKFLAGLALAVGLIGVAVFVHIAVIDIVTGLRASDHAAMSAISNQLNNYPYPSLAPFYNLGPILFQIGILTLMLQLAILKPRQLPWWSPIILFGGFLFLGFDINFLVLGAILIGLAFIPLYLGNKKAVSSPVRVSK